MGQPADRNGAELVVEHVWEEVVADPLDMVRVDVIATTEETPALTHLVLVPPDRAGTITYDTSTVTLADVELTEISNFVEFGFVTPNAEDIVDIGDGTASGGQAALTVSGSSDRRWRPSP